MALRRDNFPINVGQGLDTKTDPKHVIPGKLLLLENGVFKKRGRIDKRNGHTKLSPKTLDGTTLNSGDSLAIFNDELLQYNNQKVYSFSPGASKWIDKGTSASVIVRTKSVIKNTAEQTQVDSATLNGVGVYAWEDSRGGVRASVFDETSGTPMLTDVELDGAATRVRCLAFKSHLFVFYYKSGSLYVRRINPLSPTEFEAAVTVYNNVNTTSPTYDVYNYDNLRILWAVNRQTTTGIRAGWLNEDPAVLTGVFAETNVATEAATNCLGIVRGPGQTLYFGYHNTTNGVRAVIANNGLGILEASFNVENITASNVVNLTGYAQDDGVKMLYEVAAASSYNQLIRQNDVNDDGTAGTAADFKRSVGLHSKVFSFVGSDDVTRNYVAVAHESTLQSTYFVIRSDGLIVAKQQAGLSRGLTERPILQNVNVPSAGMYTYALLRKDRLVSEGGNLFTPTGIAETSVDFSNEDIFQAVQLGNNTHIAGGILNMYDGESVVEHGFHLYPENISSVTATSGGTLLNTTEYTAVFLYEWTDNYGQIHRSAPSLAASKTTGSGGAGNAHTVTFTVPTLRLTAKDGTNRTNVRIVGYVLDPDTDVYYRFTSVSATPNNNVAVDTIDIVLTAPAVTSNEILYTTGGVLENFAAPASSSITVFKNRIFLAGLEEAAQAWYSKEYTSGEPVEFNDTLTQTLESEGGRVTALGVLDDKLLYFKRDRFYYTFGDGPNNLGQDGSFAQPVFRTGDVGALSGVSLVRSPAGLFFKSAKGIYLVDASLNHSYVGDAVEEFNGKTITSAALVSNTNQVRFTTSDGPVLVFDYYFGQWSTFTNLSAKAGLIWNSAYVLLRTNGDVFQETEGYYKDDKTHYGVRLGTGWIALAGVGGFKWVYSLFMLGDYKSPHMLRVKVGYDYSAAYLSVKEFDPEELLEINTYGSQSPYGSGSPYGGRNSAYRFDIAMKKQKTGAIRFLIEEMPKSSTSNTEQGFNISDLILQVGLKSGLTRLGRNQSVGQQT